MLGNGKHIQFRIKQEGGGCRGGWDWACSDRLARAGEGVLLQARGCAVEVIAIRHASQYERWTWIGWGRGGTRVGSWIHFVFSKPLLKLPRLISLLVVCTRRIRAEETYRSNVRRDDRFRGSAVLATDLCPVSCRRAVDAQGDDSCREGLRSIVNSQH